MKRAVKMLVLVVGFACTCLAAAAPISTTLNAGPVPVCWDGHPGPCTGGCCHSN
jgi:hypothetical protein